ncbi:MAG: hypothetical protein WBX25_06065 [Rhodomicrobium sp.]
MPANLAFFAKSAGLGDKIAWSIEIGAFERALLEMDELLQRQPGKANLVGEWRQRIIEEQERVRAMEAARSREYRERQRQKRSATDKRLCAVCNTPLAGQRGDASFCSAKCRIRYYRQRSQLKYLAIDPEMDRFKVRGER